MCSEDKLQKPFFIRKTYNLLVSLGYITYINCILGVDEGMSQLSILLFLGFLPFSLSFFPYFHFYFLSRTQIHKRVTAQVFPFSPILSFPPLHQALDLVSIAEEGSTFSALQMGRCTYNSHGCKSCFTADSLNKDAKTVLFSS